VIGEAPRVKRLAPTRKTAPTRGSRLSLVHRGAASAEPSDTSRKTTSSRGASAVV